ncbi:ABC-type spermidine/putrescine transport system permease subunit I [Rhodoligotrophos appendicifer]|uniref:ABC transporter permease n=1 Tax=Rhodoligotrophos appendicifer TaxID=987056 RepID=UPI00117E0100|nr:ABC transporter permease [Rhodoligotrophos appendicifer]
MNAWSAVELRGGWSITRLYRQMLWAPIVFVGIFFLAPIIVVVYRSFVDPAIGFGNYRQILEGGPYVGVLLNTLQTAAIVTVLCLIVAYPLSYLMAKVRGTLLNVMVAIVVISLWTSVVIRSYAWMVIFQRRGVFNDLLMGSGVIERAVSFIPGAFAVNVGMVHIMLPFMILPLLANMRSIDRSLISAAGVMGASPWKSFRSIFVPLSLPGVSAGSAVVFMLSLGFFVTPALLGGPQHMMAAVLIEQQANHLLNWGLASALASLLLAVTIAIYLIYLRVMRYAEGDGTHAA